MINSRLVKATAPVTFGLLATGAIIWSIPSAADESFIAPTEGALELEGVRNRSSSEWFWEAEAIDREMDNSSSKTVYDRPTNIDEQLVLEEVQPPNREWDSIEGTRRQSPGVPLVNF
ncbi:hypothetical protein IQ238_03600 [Pleurocapsales cyanobacterium LEGE 06147]|nr:hypothetical protein [Pleurocapsales cyanobacterium LEGE 06147]